MRRRFLWTAGRAAGLGLAVMVAGCRVMSPDPLSIGDGPGKGAALVVDRHGAALMALPGVVGVSAGVTGARSVPCVRVYLSRGYSRARAGVPRELEGFPVVIERTDPVRPMGR